MREELIKVIDVLIVNFVKEVEEGKIKITSIDDLITLIRLERSLNTNFSTKSDEFLVGVVNKIERLRGKNNG